MDSFPSLSINTILIKKPKNVVVIKPNDAHQDNKTTRPEIVKVRKKATKEAFTELKSDAESKLDELYLYRNGT